jgi:hypothetical protein
MQILNHNPFATNKFNYHNHNQCIFLNRADEYSRLCRRHVYMHLDYIPKEPASEQNEEKKTDQET